MLTEEKIKEIRKLISRGVPEGEVKNQLQTEGYTEEDIKKIFTPRTGDMRSWFLTFAILIFIAGLILFISDSDGSLLLLILSVLLFIEYYRLEMKAKKKKD